MGLNPKELSYVSQNVKSDKVDEGIRILLTHTTLIFFV